MNLTKRNVYIVLFALLYISVALVSTIHAIAFFGLANAPLLGGLLAVTFEIGQAAVLFSILTTPQERSKVMPWCLMTILTAVQIMGNVFSSYKYLISNSVNELRYFKEPIFVWMDLPDQQCNVILTYIIGAILPIVALCMTSMLTNYLEDTSKEKQLTDNTDTTSEEIRDLQIANSEDNVQSQNTIEQQIETKVEEKPIEQQQQETSLSASEPLIDEQQKEQETEEVITEPIALPDEVIKTLTEPVEEIASEHPIEDKQVEELMTKPSSHFINL